MINEFKTRVPVFLSTLLLFLPASPSYPQGETSAVLIEGATLIDGTGRAPVPDTSILIRGDRIQRIGSIAAADLPADVHRIDGRGKFVMPALIDAHIHHKDWDGELFLAHGVTTAASLGDFTEWIMAQKEGVAKGKIRGPRLLASGHMINGPYPSEAHFRRQYFALVRDTEDARAVTRKLLAQGADVAKIYEDLSTEMLRAIIAEAHKAGKPAMGHTPDAWQALEVGYDGIVHTDGIARAIAKAPPAEKKLTAAEAERNRGLPSTNPHARMDLSQADKLIQAMVQKKLALNPTLRAAWNWKHREKFQHEDFHLLFNDPRLRYIPLDYRLGILKEYNQHPGNTGYYFFDDLPAEEQKIALQGYSNVVAFLKKFVQAGGKIFSGSDTISTPGLSLHQELQLLVEDVGLTPQQALATATKNAAEVLRIDDRLGTVQEGKIADLLILRENPLQAIRNTRTLDLVMKDGKIVDTSYHPDYTNPIPRNIPEDTAHIFPTPLIKEISPLMVTEGDSSFILTVTGTGFLPYSTVQLNGKRLATEWRGPFELAATVPADSVRSAGTYPIVVINPHPVGSVYARGASEFVYFGDRGDTSNTIYFMVKFR